MSTDAAVAWLREQVLARLAMAQALAVYGTGAWTAVQNDGDGPDFTVSDEASSDGVMAGTWRQYAAFFIAANDPRQIIADCESGLAILNEHHILTTSDRNEAYEEFSVVRIGGADRDHGCVTCHYYGMGGVKGYGICRTVKAVASGYRHRPGYAEHWGDSG